MHTWKELIGSKKESKDRWEGDGREAQGFSFYSCFKSGCQTLNENYKNLIKSLKVIIEIDLRTKPLESADSGS